MDLSNLPGLGIGQVDDMRLIVFLPHGQDSFQEEGVGDSDEVVPERWLRGVM